MSKLRIAGIILLVILAGGFVISKSFWPVFWKVHSYATKKLQVKLIEGQTDLEYAYGQDLIAEVTYLVTKNGYTIMYPTEMSENRKKYPVIVWGNGTGNTYLNYEPALKSLASYGFVVVGCDDSNMGDGSELYEMALYMKALNEDDTSELFQRMDIDNIGVAGHSQGACGAVNAATKYEDSQILFKSVFTTSLPKLSMCVDKENMKFAYWKYDMSMIRASYFGNTGTRFLDSMWISPLRDMQENFDSIPDDVEAYFAREIGANHNIVNEFHACGYLNAWFCYTLKGDMKAAEVFKGDDPELLRNRKRWRDVRSQQSKSITSRK